MHHSPLLLQLVIILVAARVCGLILRSVGQPPVIGEMAAGIVLGPIVFGAIFPEFHATLFARESLPALDSLSQLGLVLFMFIVGVEMRAPNGVRAQVKAAGAVGFLSVLFPMARRLGGILENDVWLAGVRCRRVHSSSRALRQSSHQVCCRRTAWGVMLALLMIGMFACAAITQWLQLHAVFGAFLFGACLPRDDRLLKTLIERAEHLAVIALMPIFFALAGLNTTADAFVGAGAMAMLLILFAAIAGKVAGGAAGARLAGYGWRDSLAVGSLMNARGLMELIVIKVGLDAGVIGMEIFTMLMVMAILTTVMTGPLLTLFTRRSVAGAVATPPARS